MEITFKELLDYVDNITYNDELNHRILAIAKQIKNNFKSDYSEAYIIQLMVNAYLTEKYTLELLQEYSIWNIISEKLSSIGYRGAPAAEYRFNNIPNNHEVFSADLVKAENNNKEKYFDIYGDDNGRENRDSYRIEVKATVKNKLDTVQNFHNADIVFIYALDEKVVYIKIKDLETEVYSGLIPLCTVNSLHTRKICIDELDNKVCTAGF